jgi:site-specific recombinase XerD
MKKDIEYWTKWYREHLQKEGFHSQSINAYERCLKEFFASCGIAENESAGRANALAFLAKNTKRYDSFTIHAAVRKWHFLKYGVTLGKHRDKTSDYRGGPDIDAEISLLKTRLIEDGLMGGTIKAICRANSMFLGWLFADSNVDITLVDGFAAAKFLGEQRAHLGSGSIKTEATRLRRYISFVDERLKRTNTCIPISPPCWGNSPLPARISEVNLSTLVNDNGSSLLVRAAVLLMSNLGLRCCEAAALMLNDVSFSTASVLVRAQKGNLDRRLPLDQKTGEALSQYLMLERPKTNSESFFIRAKSHRGVPITTSQLRGLIRYRARCVGIDGFGTHTLRRRSASIMVETGTPLKVVADMLGHEDIQTTTQYLRIDVEQLRKVAGNWPVMQHD